MRHAIGGLLLLFLALSGCNPDDDGGIAETGPVPDYLNGVVDLLEAQALRRDSIDWVAFREEVLALGAGLGTPAEADEALLRALELLGDDHSSIRRPDGTFLSASTVRCGAPAAPTPTLPAGIGYVRVGSFGGTDADSAAAFAGDLQGAIAAQDSAGVEGWIVDLRGNGGGNMWPMLAGIGPILGETEVGVFIEPDGRRQGWVYSRGTSYAGGNPVTTVADPYRLGESNPPVAVLLDGAVASSGEAIAIAFVGRDSTRSFGAPTCGLSTANQFFRLADGWGLWLTVSYMADRTGLRYGGPVVPDSLVAPGEAVEAALEYLKG